MVITTLFSSKMIPSLEIYWNLNLQKTPMNHSPQRKKKAPIEIDGLHR